ncbi:MAG: cupredoxin domain-containing protein [Candidatus Humimicrobiaceae bacterium]
MKISGLLVLIAILIFPVGAWVYEYKVIPGRYPEGNPGETKIINITGVADNKQGLWMLDKVSGINYWWAGGIKRADNIVVKKGDTLIFRITSADVTHSFLIEELGIDSGPLKTGFINEVKLKADKVGSYTFKCGYVCHIRHGQMVGKLIVEE